VTRRLCGSNSAGYWTYRCLPDVMLRVVPRSVDRHLGTEGTFKIMTVGRQDSAYVEAFGSFTILIGWAEGVR
jgi:hypothetical protein